ncbi:TGS domain-containing protein [Candidatus Woesearchaeota archaeon]|nr:TGS domain-containing protein [Candidatus Woesearchaeota archaeon]MBT6402032.1 TGS domain-containing protein [Candidatus Woesearchaeota archaeon]
MATNPGFDFQRAEEAYRDANGPAEQLLALQKMLKTAPKHKSSEKLNASIKERIAKLKANIERQSKSSGKGYSPTIKKEGAAQICLVGKTNSGKSRLLNALTGTNAEVAEYEFTTKKPEIGIMDYKGIKIQIVELPAIVKDFEGSVMGPTYSGILKQSDLMVLLFDTVKDKNFLDKELSEVKTKRTIYNDQEAEKFKGVVWKMLDVMKIYTKQPGRVKDQPPMAFKKGSTLRDVAKKVHKDFLKSFKYAKVYGKSAKFKGQMVGLDHILQDDDVVELHLK